MRKPKFCPECGQPLKRNIANVEMIDRDGNTVWDTHCERCGWSGRISYDIEEVVIL